jgi:hypothetical protein
MFRRIFSIGEYLAAAALVAGCSTPNLDDIDTAGREPACVRQCSATYSDCAGRAGNAMGIRVSEVLSACKASMRTCVGTCPRK